MPNIKLLSLDDICAAAARIAPYVQKTPLLSLTPTGLRLKTESLQPIGAFKLRGAFNAILSLGEEARARGVVAHSSGNHAQAVAFAAFQLGVKAAVVMPGAAPKVKLEATRSWGADVHLVDPAGKNRASKCAELADTNGYAIIEPFNSLAIMAGTGTIGLEIVAQFPAVKTVFVPVSGGGLIGGVAAAVKLTNPAVRVIGAEPELAADAQASFRQGHIVRIEPELAQRTIADGLRVPQLGEKTFAHIQACVDDIVTVPEKQIRDAMRRIFREGRLVAEPSGAVAIAAALAVDSDPAGSVAILSGGNVDPEQFAAILESTD